MKMQGHKAVCKMYRNNRYMDRLTCDLFVERFNAVFKDLLVISDEGKISPPPVGSEISYYEF